MATVTPRVPLSMACSGGSIARLPVVGGCASSRAPCHASVARRRRGGFGRSAAGEDEAAAVLERHPDAGRDAPGGAHRGFGRVRWGPTLSHERPRRSPPRSTRRRSSRAPAATIAAARAATLGVLTTPPDDPVGTRAMAKGPREGLSGGRNASGRQVELAAGLLGGRSCALASRFFCYPPRRLLGDAGLLRGHPT